MKNYNAYTMTKAKNISNQDMTDVIVSYIMKSNQCIFLLCILRLEDLLKSFPHRSHLYGEA